MWLLTIQNLQQSSKIDKIDLNILKTIRIPWTILKVHKIHPNNKIACISWNFEPKKEEKIIKPNWIYEKTMYVYLKMLSKQSKFYTSAVCDLESS